MFLLVFFTFFPRVFLFFQCEAKMITFNLARLFSESFVEITLWFPSGVSNFSFHLSQRCYLCGNRRPDIFSSLGQLSFPTIHFFHGPMSFWRCFLTGKRPGQMRKKYFRFVGKKISETIYTGWWRWFRVFWLLFSFFLPHTEFRSLVFKSMLFKISKFI